MGMRREYVETITLNQNQVEKLADFNNYWRLYGIEDADSGALTSALGDVSVILSIVCLIPGAPTAVAVASAIMGIIGGLSYNEKDELFSKRIAIYNDQHWPLPSGEKNPQSVCRLNNLPIYYINTGN